MPLTDEDAAHFCRRVGFGGSPADIAHFSGREIADVVNEVIDTVAALPGEPPDLDSPLQWVTQYKVTEWWLQRMIDGRWAAHEPQPIGRFAGASRLGEQVDRAVADGANLVSQGERKGAYFPPGVLTGVSPDSATYREELFGPVAMVFKAGSEDEAVEIANDIPFGLGSYLFTTDSEQAKRVADKIEAGMVFVNIVGADSMELPFGGVKRSGFGRELGRFGIDEFVNKKLIRIG